MSEIIAFQSASPDLVGEVRQLICRQMAGDLVQSDVDLSSDVDIVNRLAGAGFGSASIANLMDEAVLMARKHADIPRIAIAGAMKTH